MLKINKLPGETLAILSGAETGGSAGNWPRYWRHSTQNEEEPYHE